jgi:hypothetical protein
MGATAAVSAGASLFCAANGDAANASAATAAHPVQFNFMTTPRLDVAAEKQDFHVITTAKLQQRGFAN